jgi:hypothetical protein
MRQLRWRVILPVVQILVAIGLSHLARPARRPAGSHTPYLSTARAVCEGLNAPALLFRNEADMLIPIQIDHPPPSIVGFYLSELAFLLGVGILWFLVGFEFDSFKARNRPLKPRRTFAEIVFVGGLLALGFWTAAFSATNFGHLQDLGRWGNVGGPIVEAAFCWIWSIVLIVIPGIQLGKILVNRQPKAIA